MSDTDSKAKIVTSIPVGSNKEPLGKTASETSCRHTDILPSGNDVIATVEKADAHEKNTHVRGIHEGKRPKFVKHPDEKEGNNVA